MTSSIVVQGSQFYRTEMVDPASAVIKPGQVVEQHNSGGMKLRPLASADNMYAMTIALENPYVNSDAVIDQTYAVGDTVRVAYMTPGDIFYARCNSGETVNLSTKLSVNASGQFVSAAVETLASGTARVMSLESKGLLAADTLVKVRMIS